MNPTNSSEAYKNLQDFNSNRTNLSDLYSGAEKETGVSDARLRAQQLKQAASATEGLIRGVDPSVTGRLQGGLATEAQRQRLIALETQPLTEMYRTQSGAYDTANSEYSDAAARADRLASMRYTADNDKFNQLQTLYNTLLGQEQAAEEKRRWEAQQAEARRQFNEQMAQARRASSGGGFSMSPTFGGGATSSGNKPGQSPEEAFAPEAARIKAIVASGEKNYKREIANLQQRLNNKNISNQEYQAIVRDLREYQRLVPQTSGGGWIGASY